MTIVSEVNLWLWFCQVSYDAGVDPTARLTEGFDARGVWDGDGCPIARGLEIVSTLGLPDPFGRRGALMMGLTIFAVTSFAAGEARSRDC